MNDEYTSNSDPIAHTTLRSLMKEHSDPELWVKRELEFVMKDHLLNAFQVVWEETNKSAKKRDSKTIEEVDLRNGLNSVFYQHSLMEEVATLMDEYQLEFSRAANQSPLIDLEIESDGETEDDE